jgi:hypothetical protein
MQTASSSPTSGSTYEIQNNSWGDESHPMIGR